MVSANINYDNHSAMYQPGDTVSGSVNVYLTKPTHVKKIIVQAKGHCTVRYWRGAGESRHVCTAHETYLDTKLPIYTQGEKGDAHQQQLSAGSHSFAFQFQLPDVNVPSSVEARYGHIRYECKATVSVPWTLDVHTSSPFTVQKIIDLNLAPPAFKEPIVTKSDGVVGMMHSGLVHASLRLPRAGFTPGQDIPFHVHLVNRSQSAFDLKVSLKERMRFQARGGFMSGPQNSKSVLARTVRRVGEGSEIHWDGVLQVPVSGILQARLDGCTIMSLRHVVTVKVALVGGVALEQDIVIGHLPLDDATPPYSFAV